MDFNNDKIKITFNTKDGKKIPDWQVDENGYDKFPFKINLRSLGLYYPDAENLYIESKKFQNGCKICFPDIDGEKPYIEIKYEDGETKRFYNFRRAKKEELEKVDKGLGNDPGIIGYVIIEDHEINDIDSDPDIELKMPNLPFVLSS
jgi:hypothetical protein